ncbi:tetratricopeptide repeat protein [Lutibacter holmesii]|uniref:histidine kinase n=1 Tax=Lutibacter holmesii TaxID=1137985 RepID=A0ABW3WS76_9FLAO
MKNKILFFYFLFFFIFLYGQNSTTSLKTKLQQEQVDTSKVRLNVEIANSFSIKQKDSVLHYYNKALRLADSISYKHNLADLLFSHGTEFENINNFEQAIVNYELSISIYEELEQVENVGSLYNLIGYCYLNLYAEDKAIEYYLKSLNISQSLNDNEGVAMNYNDIGNLYYDQEHYENAITYFKKALSLYENLEDKEGLSSVYTNLGNAYSDLGDYTKGMDYYRRSIHLELELNDEGGIAVNYNNLGDCNIQLGDLENAESYFEKAIEIANKINDQELLAIIYLNLADLQQKSKKYSQTIFYALKSLNISKVLGRLEIQSEDLKYLAEAYERKGDVENALLFQKELTVVNDSLLNYEKVKKVQLFNALNKLEQNSTTISDLATENRITQLKYKNEKKISHYLIIAIVVFAFLIIVLIHQQTAKKKAYNLLEFRNFQISRMNTEIEEQRDYLNQLNKTKDKFFSIIAHDLKNPFNSIKGFTELLIDNRGDYDSEKQLKFLRIIKDSTVKASTLLNNLLTWANSQSGNLTYSPKKIELVLQVIDVVSLLEIQAVKKDIHIFNNIDHNLTVAGDENMVNTIFRNLISNAVKFTKPNGEVRIESSLKNNMVEISVKDNGVGISDEDLKNIFSLEVKNTQLGTAKEQGSGLGLILCKDFVEKHGGKIWVNSVLGEGTEFTFTLPVWKDEELDVFIL